MNSSLLITFDLQSEWHIGSGEEAGAYADALVLKDSNGLPYIPGKSVKGLLREAMQTAQDNGWFKNTNLVDILFGFEGQEESTQGKINVSSATLSKQEIAFFKKEKQAKKHLFRVLTSTAIEHKTGVAKDSSLRSIEVTVPMCLTAKLVLSENNPMLLENIKSTLPLITHLGAKRHRGLGVVFVSVAKE